MNRATTRITTLLTALALAGALAGCATARPAAESPPTSSEAAAGGSEDALHAMLLMELAIPETWERQWAEAGCTSASVAEGVAACVEKAAGGAVLAHRLVDKVTVLAENGMAVDPMRASADAGRAAGEAFYAALCDRAVSPECGPLTEGVVAALHSYGQAVKTVLG